MVLAPWPVSSPHPPLCAPHPLPRRQGDYLICPWHNASHFWVAPFFAKNLSCLFWLHQYLSCPACRTVLVSTHTFIDCCKLLPWRFYCTLNIFSCTPVLQLHKSLFPSLWLHVFLYISCLDVYTNFLALLQCYRILICSHRLPYLNVLLLKTNILTSLGFKPNGCHRCFCCIILGELCFIWNLGSYLRNVVSPAGLAEQDVYL